MNLIQMKTRYCLFLMVLMTSLTVTYGQVKIGNNPTTINASAALEIESANKGMLLPRVVLTSETDGTTISLPAKGLLVYHTGTTLYGEGIYVNLGTDTSPKWSLLTVQNTQYGATHGKLSYLGQFDGTKTLKVGDLEFRGNPVPSSGTLAFQYEVRMVSAPTATVSYNVNRTDWYNSCYACGNSQESTLSFTTSNWNTWQIISSHNGYAGSHANMIYISSPQIATFYRVSTHAKAGTFVTLVVDTF